MILFIIIALCAIPVSAMEFTAPAAPDSAQQYIPDESSSFLEDLWYVLKSAISQLNPKIAEASKTCISLIAVMLLMAMLQSFSGNAKQAVDLVGVISITTLLLRPSNSLIQLSLKTVEELSEYGKLFLPVMTGALAAQGGTTTSAALYAGTVAFNTFLSALIAKLIVPMLFVYIVLCVARSAIDEKVLKKLRDFAKWLMTWTLKITIYLFTGYLSVTGVVSGTADAAAVKAAKLAINGFVPVVGSIVSDASETILVSAGMMKNTAGIYGLIVIIAMCIGPFLEIGVQYLMLKATASVCGIFDSKGPATLIDDFSGVMGFLLAMTGTVSLLLLISTVCFMRGVA